MAMSVRSLRLASYGKPYFFPACFGVFWFIWAFWFFGCPAIIGTAFHSLIINASRVLPSSVLLMYRDKLGWYVCILFDGAADCCVSIPSYNILHVSAIAHVMHNMIHLVLMLEARILWGALRVVTYLVGPTSHCSRGTWSGPWLSIRSIHSEICRRMFSRQLLWVFELMQSAWEYCTRLYLWMLWEGRKMRRYCGRDFSLIDSHSFVCGWDDAVWTQPSGIEILWESQSPVVRWMSQLAVGSRHRRIFQASSCL